MRLANKIFVLFLLLVPILGMTQISAEAWSNYARSKFEVIPTNADQDAVVIYDRTYYDIASDMGTVILINTVHRKVKINSLYGLEKFNKLYISTLDDLEFNLEFINCKAKVLKPDGTVIKTEKSELVTTTLPANAPFFYKKEGNVKMLALNNVSIGDEVEYVYSTRSIYQIAALNFYKSDRVSFSNDYLQLEKSISFESKRFETRIWPHNFSNGNTRDTDFSHEDGVKISLKNIKPKGTHPYANASLDEPYVNYLMADFLTDDQEDSWAIITRDFRVSKKDVRYSRIFNGKDLFDAIDEVEGQNNKLKKFNLLLDKLNARLEKNFHLYDEFRNDISVSWGYAEMISKMMKKQKIPLNFHFVVNKNSGAFDPSYVSIYQFDNIIISFLDDKGEKHFMSLLEPYSELDEIKSEFHNTDCFTISQSETGKRKFSFEKMPATKLTKNYTKLVQVGFAEESSGTVLSIDEEVIFDGQIFVDYKPDLLDIINDTEDEKMERFEYYINNQIVASSEIDSVSNIQYELGDDQLKLSYHYNLPIEFNASAPIINLKLEDLVPNYFYTPLSIRNKINSNGYLYSSYDTKYEVEFNTAGQYEWMENKFLNQTLENAIGKATGAYTKTDSGWKITYGVNFKKEKFTPADWKSVLGLRDQSYEFLNRNIYFQRK